MPLFDHKTGRLIGSSRKLFDMNKAFANGTLRYGRPLSRPADYGPRLRAVAPRVAVPADRMTAKKAFRYEASARDTKLGGYLTVSGEEDMKRMRGRAKGATDLFTGPGGQRMSLVPDMGEIRASSASYVTVPPSAVQISTQMGQIPPTAEQVLWQRDFAVFAKDVMGFHLFTPNSTERRVYRKGMLLVPSGKTVYSARPVVLASIRGLEGELGRWSRDRAGAITEQPVGNQFSLAKIRGRMINAINAVKTVVGLAAISPMPQPQPIVPRPGEAPGAAAPAPVVAPPTWLERNKTLVIGGVLLLAAGGAYMWYRRR